ncbi:MAG: fumarylacetoacetate hydrolase family protein [Pseudomonadota bacterium]
MKLASLKAGGRDGTLIVVSRDLSRYVEAGEVARTLQAALDDWDAVAPRLAKLSDDLNAGALGQARAFDPKACAAPLPRAYHWVDGSAYVNHVELVRKARGAEMPASFWDDPLVYQGGSDDMLGPCDDILVPDEAFGIDLEGEVAVITDDVPMGTDETQAASHIKLLLLVNDVSLRNLIPGELAKGFGFYQSKPATAFSPVAVTPDELGAAWRAAKVHLPLLSQINGAPFGKPDAGVDMTFSFARLIAHVTKTRRLGAGAIIGSGTVSNKQDGGPGKPIGEGGLGYSCIAELRMIETITSGAPKTDFLKFGDRVRLEMLDEAGRSVFGAIDQRVAKAP